MTIIDRLQTNIVTEDHIAHYGVKGQKWGVRRYQNEDGTLISKVKHFSVPSNFVYKKGLRAEAYAKKRVESVGTKKAIKQEKFLRNVSVGMMAVAAYMSMHNIRYYSFIGDNETAIRNGAYFISSTAAMYTLYNNSQNNIRAIEKYSKTTKKR